MISYFRNKQSRILKSVQKDFIRTKYLKKLESKNRLVGLIGQRGVGKSTLLLQYLEKNYKLSEFLYFSADDIYIAGTKLYDIANEFVMLGGKVIAIDEVHKYQNWSQELKNIYDSFPELLIRFSGSSMLNILSGNYDLSRRAVRVFVNNLSFREYMHLAHNIELPLLKLDDILKNSDDLSTNLALKHNMIYSSFLEYLQSGAYPFFIEDKDEFKSKIFNGLETIINEDIPSLNNIDYNSLSIFKILISKLVESRVPYKVNLSKLSKEFGVTYPTLISYLDILKDTKIFNPIKKYSKKLSKKPEKLLFYNTNILYSYSSEFGIDVDIGTVRETFFANCFSNIFYSDIGDFRMGDYIFEVGGKNKDFKQIQDIANSYLVVDTDYVTSKRKIPLWLFGLIE